MIKNFNEWNWGAIGVIVAILFGIPVWLSYLNTSQVEIVAQGKTNQWFIPEPISGKDPLRTLYVGLPDPSPTLEYLKEVRSYVEFSIQNNGSALAEDVQLNLNYNGIFSTDYGKTLESFDSVVLIGELRPKETKYVLVWTNANETERVNKGLVNFKNGSVDVDFSVFAFGIWKNILLFLSKFWILFLVTSCLVVLFLVVRVFEKKTKLLETSQTKENS